MAGAEHLVNVVDVVPTVGGVVVEHGLHVFLGEVGHIVFTAGDGAVGQLVHHLGHVIIMSKLGAVHELWEVGVHRQTILSVIAHLCLALGTLLRCNDDHTASGVQTIHGSGGTVFQHRHALDVVGVDVVDRTGHAVNDVEGLHARSADAERCLVVARLTRGLHRRDAGELTAEQTRHVGRRTLEQLVALHGSHGSCERLLACCAVAHHDHVGQVGVVVLQRYVYDALAANLDIGGLHAYIREREIVGLLFGAHVYGIATVNVGHGSGL